MGVVEEIIEYLRVNPTFNVNEYFKSIVWSMESEEWSKVADEEKCQFEQLLRGERRGRRITQITVTLYYLPDYPSTGNGDSGKTSHERVIS